MKNSEGKEGHRIYKNREDALFLSDLANKRGVENEILKIRVKDEKLAEEMGFTVHHDISIAANKPSAGEEGWILSRQKMIDEENLEKAIEITEKMKNTDKG